MAIIMTDFGILRKSYNNFIFYLNSHIKSLLTYLNMVILSMVKKSKKTIEQIKIIEGKIPVLILAGHAHTHRRPNLMGNYKLAEPWTDYIARNVAKSSGAHAIYLNTEVDYDPNVHSIEENPFKQAVAEFCSNHKVDYIFDLHGLNDKHQFDIGVFYGNRYAKSKQLAFDLADELNGGKLKDLLAQVFNFSDDYFDNGEQKTLTQFVVEKYKASGVQVEIARYIREDEMLRNALIEGMSRFIISL
jgi:hypothetical protein